jgi:hypothetical protein
MKKKVLTFGNNFKQIQNKFVKTPAVKPCIVYIIDLPDSGGSKQCRPLTGSRSPHMCFTHIVG